MKFKPNLSKSQSPRALRAALEDLDAELDLEITGDAPADAPADAQVETPPAGDTAPVTGEAELPPVDGEPPLVETETDTEIVDAAGDGVVDEVNVQEVAPMDTTLDIGEPGGDADLEIETEAQAESDAEDEDVDNLVDGITALEGLQDMFEALPAGADGKYTAAMLKSMRPALEANELVASNQGALVGDGQKEGVGQRVKEFIKQAIQALIKMALEAIAKIKELWSNATDKLMRSANAAKQLMSKINSTQFNGSGAITDEKLISLISSSGGITPIQALTNSFEHAAALGDRATSDLLINAGAAIRELAKGSTADDARQKVYQSIEALAPAFSDRANVNGADVPASKPLFGGFRAWVSMPDSLDNMEKFNHGITQVDKAGSGGQLNAGSANELLSICQAIIKASELEPAYRKKMNEEEKLVAEIKSAGAGAKDGDEAVQKALSSLQKTLPRIIKGPQVAAYTYAGTAAAIGIRYVMASLAAHAGGAEKSSLPAQNTQKALPAAA